MNKTELQKPLVITLVIVSFIFGTGVSYLLSYSLGAFDSDSYNRGSNDQSLESKKKEDKAAPLYWVAPMDANYRRDKPGQSPMGMDLVPVYADADTLSDKPGTVKISPLVENNLGVRIKPVIKSPLTLTIATVGYVTFDEKTLSHFHSRVDGWVEQLSVVSQGDSVKKGQKIFELYSPELVNAQEEYLAALNTKNRGLIHASKKKLDSLGVSSKQINQLKKNNQANQRLSFYADQDGYIATLNVREGSFIKPAKKVLSIGSLKSVWVIAEVFERQTSWLLEGQTVIMTTDSFPGRQWKGEVDYIYPVLNSKTRTLQARIHFRNEDEQLKPNMFARLTIHTKSIPDALSIPREAIIHSAQMDRAVKALGDGKFRSVRIETGVEVGNRVQILKGLAEGENVVTSAQFLIDSESSIDAELSRIEGEPSNYD
ncbi:MAG: efflux RND transporter periplasmic adaptor subunit [Pseudomonadales bacterium]|nr:efflux RND transporter periplasmic adaptor subunit [Pseudomonadales bacterium]